MTNLKTFGQWLRFISAAETDSACWRHPTVRKVLGLMVEHGKAQLLTALNVLSNQPVTVTVKDDGDRRIVTAMQTDRYGYNRRDRTFFAAAREEDGYWCDVPHDDCNTVTFDTFLPQRS